LVKSTDQSGTKPVMKPASEQTVSPAKPKITAKPEGPQPDATPAEDRPQ
jgi:hypothetical protein